MRKLVINKLSLSKLTLNLFKLFKVGQVGGSLVILDENTLNILDENELSIMD